MNFIHSPWKGLKKKGKEGFPPWILLTPWNYAANDLNMPIGKGHHLRVTGEMPSTRLNPVRLITTWLNKTVQSARKVWVYKKAIWDICERRTSLHTKTGRRVPNSSTWSALQHPVVPHWEAWEGREAMSQTLKGESDDDKDGGWREKERFCGL